MPCASPDVVTSEALIAISCSLKAVCQACIRTEDLCDVQLPDACQCHDSDQSVPSLRLLMSTSRSLSDHAASFRRNIQPGTRIFVCVSNDQKSHLLNTLFCLLNQLETLELRWAM